MPWLAGAVGGTPLMSLWLRGLGARIGRGVWCETYWLPEADLIRIGDGATVNRGCVVQTHLFHDRIMRMDQVTLDEGATLGPHGIVLPGAAVGAHATVGPASLVMRGETVPGGGRWLGNPIAAWPARLAAPRVTRRECRPPRTCRGTATCGYRVDALRPGARLPDHGPGRLSGRATIAGVGRPTSSPSSAWTSARSGSSGCWSTARRPGTAIAAASCGSGPAGRCPPGRPFTVTVRYAGTPRPIPSRWGDLGWERARPTARSSRASRSGRRPGSRATTTPPTRPPTGSR